MFGFKNECLGLKILEMNVIIFVIKLFMIFICMMQIVHIS